tara:strand:+ start:307 stop:642 length:336 start_codon:yes stop_codon:yes gene_type:complete
MKPDVERILAKLSKDKVELGLIQFAEADAKKLLKFARDLEQSKREINKQINDLSKIIAPGLKLQREVRDAFLKIKKMQKDLGANSSEVKAAIALLEDSASEFNSAFMIKIK